MGLTRQTGATQILLAPVQQHGSDPTGDPFCLRISTTGPSIHLATRSLANGNDKTPPWLVQDIVTQVVSPGRLGVDQNCHELHTGVGGEVKVDLVVKYVCDQKSKTVTKGNGQPCWWGGGILPPNWLSPPPPRQCEARGSFGPHPTCQVTRPASECPARVMGVGRTPKLKLCHKSQKTNMLLVFSVSLFVFTHDDSEIYHNIFAREPRTSSYTQDRY